MRMMNYLELKHVKIKIFPKMNVFQLVVANGMLMMMMMVIMHVCLTLDKINYVQV